MRQRDAARCCVCGSTQFLQAHHILFKEVYPEYQTDLDNGIALCVRHHRFSRFSAHQNPLFFVDWLKRNRPEQYELAMSRINLSPETQVQEAP